MARKPRPIPSDKRITALVRAATVRASTAKFFFATTMVGPIQVGVQWIDFVRPPRVSGSSPDGLVVIPRRFEEVAREAARGEWEKLKKKRKRPPVPPRPVYHGGRD